VPGGSGRAKEALPTMRQDPGCLDPRGWRRAFNLRSCCHPRPPPPPQLPPGPLPRCRGSLEGCRRKAIRPPAGRGRLPGPGKGIAPAGWGKRDPRFPHPRQQSPTPAGGRAGAGRGLWPQAGQGSAWRCGRGDGPCHGSGESAFVSPGGNRKRDPRFPRPRATAPCGPAGPGTPEASARPGGGEAPAGGGAGAGRGLWPPARLGSAWRCGRGDGPCHCSGDSPFVSASGGNATRVSPARARRFHKNRCRPHQRQANTRPGGREAPVGDGAGDGRGLRPPAGPDPGGTLWQGRWPLPGCAKSAQAQEVAVLRSGSPGGRHLFNALSGQEKGRGSDARDMR